MNTRAFIKKIVLGSSFLLMFSGVIAQNNFPIVPPTADSADLRKDTTRAWHGFYINPDITIGPSGSFSGNGIGGSLGFDAGVQACYMFNPHFGIALGLQYGQYQFKYNYSNVISEHEGMSGYSYPTHSSAYDTAIVAGYTTDATYSLSMLKIPLLLRYFSNSSYKVSLFAEAGIVADLVLGSQVSGTASETEYVYQQPASARFYNFSSSTVFTANITDITPNVSGFNLSARAVVGIAIPLGERASMAFGISYDLSLLNAGTGSNDVIKFSDATYYFYGQNSNYGSLNMIGLNVKFIYKL